MASDFRCIYYTAVETGPMNLYFVPDATNGAGIRFGDLVFRAGDGEVELCATDPATILGIAQGSFADRSLWQNTAGVGRLPIHVLTSNVRLGLCVGAGTLSTANLGIDYGTQKLASGNFGVNLADTTGPTFHIVEVDVTNQIAWGYFLAAALQDDGIAS